jgi:hypothetical protein
MEDFVKYLVPNLRYFNAPLASVESDILEIECLKLPILVTGPKDYLTLQASSVSFLFRNGFGDSR